METRWILKEEHTGSLPKRRAEPLLPEPEKVSAMSYRIKFGTSGWRDSMDTNFTGENVARATVGIGRYLNEAEGAGLIIIAHDTRRNSQKFAGIVATVLSDMGFDARVTAAPTPTPVLSFAIKNGQTVGGVAVTASHNPKADNGIKFMTKDGSAALPKTTNMVESLIPESVHLPPIGQQKTIEVKDAYMSALRSRVDLSEVEGISIVVDPMHGTAGGYLRALLSEAGARVTEIRGDYDPDFGGLPAPNPEGTNTRMLIETVKRMGAAIGIATDGDADRCAVVDGKGKAYTANEMALIICDYLFGKKRVEGDVARNLTTTSALDRLAKRFGRKVIETPVGFKYIAEAFKKGAAVGVEGGSFGIGIGGWIPDKDGILVGAMMVEAITKQGTTLDKLWARVSREYGYGEHHEYNIPVNEEVVAAIEDIKKDTSSVFGSLHIAKKIIIDGVKLYFDGGSWVCVRKSGTEPVVRIYLEAANKKLANEIRETTARVLSVT
jgi:phosphomannomutase